MKLKIKKIKKLCIVTSSRADYGLFSNILKKIKNKNIFKLQIIVTGSHLEKKYGFTINEILKDGFKPKKKIKLDFKKDNFLNLSNQFSRAILEFTKCYLKIKPDLILIIGDRYEALAAAISGFFSKIKIGHIHGGELTEGSIDDSFRHCITKLSDLHFTAHPDYKRRVVQLGESPQRVFTIGGLGAEIIKYFKPISKNLIEKTFNIKFGKKNLLVTIHPNTLKVNDNKKFVYQILLALSKLKNTNLFFTYPNFDPGNLIIKNMILKFKSKSKNNVYIFKSLGSKFYLSFLNYVDAVVGNSSSGISEAPSLGIPTVNVGDRQKGRVLANSIINCRAEYKAILKSIKKIYDKKFKLIIKNQKSPYYFGNASSKLINILQNIDLNKINSKRFFDIYNIAKFNK